MSYRRDIFEKGFSITKKEIYRETKNFHNDIYTGQPLIPGGTWDYEHIISAKEFSDLPNVQELDFETQSKILNHRNNIGCTDRIINKSKSKYDLMEWLNRKSNGRNLTNSEFYNIDTTKAKKLRNTTLNFLIAEINRHCSK